MRICLTCERDHLPPVELGIPAAVQFDDGIAHPIAPAAEVEDEPHNLDAGGVAGNKTDDVRADLAQPLGTGDEPDVAALGVELLLAAVWQAADGLEHLAVWRLVLFVEAERCLPALKAVVDGDGRDGPSDAVAGELDGVLAGLPGLDT